MIVVVGGSSRKAGKTTVVCEIIAATPEANWTAIKITPHLHEVSEGGDTKRFQVAGAHHAVLENDPRNLSVKFTGNIVIESNSILDVIKPDLFVFVDGGSKWKESARRHASRADVVVHGHATPELLKRIRANLSPA